MSLKNLKNEISSLFESLKETIKIDKKEKPFIPDIITFCNDEKYLGLPHGYNKINLFPMQELVLKCFYRGSEGNEHVKFTEEEINILKENDLCEIDEEGKGNGDILFKLGNGEVFRELVLVWGRRSGKGFITSLIASYEAMKLLEAPGGDPYKLFGDGLAAANDITILSIANSRPQAGLTFTEIKDKILNSNYFKDKYIAEGIEAQKIHLLTPQDKKINKDLKQRGINPEKGSICIEVGHSNSDSLVGKGCFVLILDEVGLYKNTGGASSGEAIYGALKPTLSTYYKKKYLKDKDGNQILDENGDPEFETEQQSKIIYISSPRGKEGILYQAFSSTMSVPHRMTCRLPTWVVNPHQTIKGLKKENTGMSNQKFDMEFGAQFMGISGESFFSRENVLDCFSNNYTHKKSSMLGQVYYCHLDPATSSHNYALVLLHKNYFFDPNLNKMSYSIVVDHINHWSPIGDDPIKVNDVDKYIINLQKKFNISMLGTDPMISPHSMIKFKKNSIPVKKLTYNKRFKMKIYSELEQLIVDGRLKIPIEGESYALLMQEMLNLQRRFDNTGFSVYHKKDGDGCKSDDVVDALAGAVYLAVEEDTNKFPKSQLVRMPISINRQSWNSMQGEIPNDLIDKFL